MKSCVKRMSNKAWPVQCLSTMKGRHLSGNIALNSCQISLSCHYTHPHTLTHTYLHTPTQASDWPAPGPPGGSALCTCAFLGPQTNKHIQGQQQTELNSIWLLNTLSGPGLTQHRCGPVHTLTQQTRKADTSTLPEPSRACTHSLTKPSHAIMPGKRG